MINIANKKALVILSMVAIAAMLGGIYITVYAADNNAESTAMSWLWRGDRRLPRFRAGSFRFMEISEDYETKVIGIAESDEDVQGLLVDGYNIIGVKPIIKSVVDGDGDVTTTATNAIVILKTEDGSGYAAVMVDLNTGTVTKIVILTRTVIDKT